MSRTVNLVRYVVVCVLALAALFVVSPAGPVRAAGELTFVVDLSKGSGTTVELPLSGLGHATIDWGGAPAGCVAGFGTVGSPVQLAAQNISCDYGVTSGVKTIRVTGLVPQIGRVAAVTGAAKFISLFDWGSVGTTSLEGAFVGMTNLVDVPNSLPAAVTSLQATFFGASSFNDADIEAWNTANVNTLQNTFSGATAFAQSLSTWDTSGVTNMQGTFSDTANFNGSVGLWNTSNVTNMFGTFWNATAFNQPVPWNTSSVVTMQNMFTGATSFNQQLSWDTSNVTNMREMFKNASSFDQNLNWDVSSVTTLVGMFSGATSFNRNLSNWNPASLTSSGSMFFGATSFNNGCPSAPTAGAFNCPLDWDDTTTPALLDVGGMFAGASSFNQAVRLDSGLVTSTNEMFQNATAFNNGCPSAPAAGAFGCPLDLPTNSVTAMGAMFQGATAFNQSVNALSTNLVTSFIYTFSQATSFNNGCATGSFVCPLNWNTGSATTLSNIFASASSFNQSVSSWNVANVTYFGQVFYGAGSFNNGCAVGSAACPLDWTTTNATFMGEMFTGNTVFDQALPNFDTDQVTNTALMFKNASRFNQPIGSWNMGSLTNANEMFRGALQFNRDLSTWCPPATVSRVDYDTGTPAWTSARPQWGGCVAPIVSVPQTTSTTSTTAAPTTLPSTSGAGSTTIGPSVGGGLPVTGSDRPPRGIAVLLLGLGALLVITRHRATRSMR